MSIVYTDDQYYYDIGNAIREKNGTQITYKPSEMANAVKSISSGASDYIEPPIYPTPTVTLTVT